VLILNIFLKLIKKCLILILYQFNFCININDKNHYHMLIMSDFHNIFSKNQIKYLAANIFENTYFFVILQILLILLLYKYYKNLS